jgi:hypothetical protein
MDRTGEWLDTLGVLARSLEEKTIVALLDQWQDVYRRDGNYLVTFVGRGSAKSRLVGRLLGRPIMESETGKEYTHAETAAVPPGVRCLDTVPFDAVGASVDRLAWQLRRSDAVVLVVAATSAAGAADVDLLRNQIVNGAHVPCIHVVITRVFDLEPDETEVVIRHVRRTLGSISPRVIVSIEPSDDSPNRPQWQAELFPDRPPNDLATKRVHQAFAQLRDLAADLEGVALHRADVADTQARMDTGQLSAAEIHAERLLDVAAVRRELRVRQQSATDILAGLLDESRRWLSAEADRALRGSRGGEDAIRGALDRYREQVDESLAEVQSKATSTVKADVAWLNERLAMYADAWQVAHGELPQPHLGASRILADLGPLPAVREHWILRKLAGPAGVLAGIAVNAAGEAFKSRFERVDKKDLGRIKLVALKASDKGGSEISRAARDVVSDSVTRLAEYLEGGLRIGGAKTVLLEANRSLEVDRDELTTAVAAVYNELAEEFDNARRDWRKAQQERATQQLTAAGDHWRGAANCVRTVQQEIATATSAEERG